MTACKFKSSLMALALAALAPLAHAWEPMRPVELVVPAGTGGGADQMARFIQGVIAKHQLMKQAMVVVNKSGGAGAEGFLELKDARGDPHKLVISLSNLFTTPLATGLPFNWRDLTPVSMLALDQFVLWVNVESPYKSTRELLDAIKSQPHNSFKLGGTGAKQEDQIIGVMLEHLAGKKITYIPYKGGGEVAVQLVGRHVDLSVNNPIEAESHWRAGKLRPLCVFDAARLAYPVKLSHGQSWQDIPTCAATGMALEYQMLRGIFMPGGVSKEQLAFYVDLLAKVRATPDWKELMEKGAFRQTTLSGEPLHAWLGKQEHVHRELMKQAGFLAK